jgi:hypothetical protein
MAASDARGGPNNRIFLQEGQVTQKILAADAANTLFFRAPFPLRILSVHEQHSVLCASGTATVRKVSGVTAPGSGTVVMIGTFDLSATINTQQVATLSTTAADRVLAAGDWLAITLGGTLTGLIGAISVVFEEID